MFPLQGAKLNELFKGKVVSAISPRAFAQGMAVVGILYIAAFGWAALRGSHTQTALESRSPFGMITVTAVGQRAPDTHAHSDSDDTGGTEHAETPHNDTASHGDAVHGTENHGTPATDHDAMAAAPDGLALIPAPIAGLHEDLPGLGSVPAIRASDGMTPFRAYRRPFDRQATDKPVISIALIDLGLSVAATESALRVMPPEVSFGLSAYAETPDLWVNQARSRGHEVWLMLPLEAARYPAIDPGPHTLLVGVPQSENELKIRWLMARAPGYAGFIADGQHSPFLKSDADMRPVMNNIYSHGLGFVNIAAEPGSLAETISLGRKAPYANIDLVVDETTSPEAIDAQFAKLEEIARTRNAAIGLIHPLPVSYQKTLDWIKSLPDKGFVLAPISAHAGY